MSGKRVLALYAAVLLGFAVVLCRLYFLAENHTYAARAEAQSTVRLSLPARRGSFYDHSGLLLTGLETRYLASASRAKTTTHACMHLRTVPGRHFCTGTATAPHRFCWKWTATFPRAAYAALQRHGAAQKFRCASI